MAEAGERPRPHRGPAGLLDVALDSRTRAAPTGRGRGSPSPPGGRALRERPGARPRPRRATGSYQRARVSPSGRGRPAHRARRSISFKVRITHRLGSFSEIRPNAIVASRSSTARRRRPAPRGRPRQPAGRRRGLAPTSRRPRAPGRSVRTRDESGASARSREWARRRPRARSAAGPRPRSGRHRRSPACAASGGRTAPAPRTGR